MSVSKRNVTFKKLRMQFPAFTYKSLTVLTWITFFTSSVEKDDFNFTHKFYCQKLEAEHLSNLEEKLSDNETTDDPVVSNVPARIREIVTKSISPPAPRNMSREASLANENRLLQDEMSRLEDLLAATRAERDEIGSKYSALSERVSLNFLFI